MSDSDESDHDARKAKKRHQLPTETERATNAMPNGSVRPHIHSFQASYESRQIASLKGSLLKNMPPL